MRRNDVASTSFRRHVPTGFLINQCQIITFIILKSDIENSRIELRGIVLPVPSNQIKVTFIIILPLNLVQYICDFFLFHIEIEGKGGWMMAPSQIIGGLPPPPPLTSSYAYDRPNRRTNHALSHLYHNIWCRPCIITEYLVLKNGYQNQNCLLVIRPRTIIHQDLCLGKLVPSHHKRSKLSN